MTSVVMSDSGGNIVEYVTVMEEPQQVGPGCRLDPDSCLLATQHKTTWNI